MGSLGFMRLLLSFFRTEVYKYTYWTLLSCSTSYARCITLSYEKLGSNLKVLLSIGGWSYRDNFRPLGGDEKKRTEFAGSGVRLVEDLGLDG